MQRRIIFATIGSFDVGVLIVDCPTEHHIFIHKNMIEDHDIPQKETEESLQKSLEVQLKDPNSSPFLIQHFINTEKEKLVLLTKTDPPIPPTSREVGIPLFIKLSTPEAKARSPGQPSTEPCFFLLNVESITVTRLISYFLIGCI